MRKAGSIDPVIVNALRRNPRPSKPVLDADASGPVRDRLVNEIVALGAVETAIEWAGQNVGVQSTLTAEDASIVEAAFRGRMRVLEPEVYSPSEPVDPPTGPAGIALQPGSAGSAGATAATEARVFPNMPPRPRKIQSSKIGLEGGDNLTSVKLRRSRDKDHLRFIARQPCTVCGRLPCEAHHLRFSQPRALGRRVSDEFTVPLCRVHHRELHRQGDERTWWSKANIDPMPIALVFWRDRRGVLADCKSGLPGSRSGNRRTDRGGEGLNSPGDVSGLVDVVADGSASR